MAEATAIIYIMESSLGNKVYIGSTIRTLQERMYQHKSQHNTHRQCSSHILFDDYGDNNITMRILEIVPITLKYNREQYWILQHPNAINQIKAFRSKEDRKEQIKQKNKKKNEEYKNNPKYIICECGIKSRYHTISTHRKTQKHIQRLHTAQTETKSPE